MGEAIPWTFKTWIERFKSVDLPIGDFAHEVLQDAEFPTEDYLCEILEHLQNKRVSPKTIEVFCEAWNYYLASNSKPDSYPTFSQ